MRGKASEALQSRKAEKQIGRAGNEGRRPNWVCSRQWWLPAFSPWESGMAMIGADQGMTIYGPLLLALLGVSGPGRYSLDRLIVRWAGSASPPDDGAPHVVFVGGGFGGMACAAGLRHERARVTLVDRHNYHLF